MSKADYLMSVLRSREGAPGVSRTRDQQFRKLLLYPSELQGRARPFSDQAMQDKRLTRALPRVPLSARHELRRTPARSERSPASPPRFRSGSSSTAPGS